MKTFCKYISIFNLLLGTIGSFFLAKINGIELKGIYLRPSRDWATTIIIFTVSMVIVITISVILYSLNVIINNQEIMIKKIQENETNVIDKLEKTPTELDNEIPKDKWKCDNCNTINPNYVGTCRCGTSKH